MRALRFLLVTVAVSLLAAPAANAARWQVDTPPPSTRIVNGSTPGGTVPWQVGLVQVKDGSTSVPLFVYCGGTLISPTVVVTAAHCLPDDPGDDPEEIGVVAGLFRLSNPGATNAQLKGVTKITTHPSYRSTSEGFDAALLTLSSAVTTSADVATRPLAPSGFAIPSNSSAMISGWGHTQSGGQSPDDLLYTTISIHPDNQCSNYAAAFKTATMICAGFVDNQNRVYDTCQGDSGGPLMRYTGNGGSVPTWGQFTAQFTQLIGIVSFGRGCADAQFPGIYTKVAEPSINALLASSNPTARVKRAGAPQISASGSTVTCTNAQWGNAPTQLDRAWLRVEFETVDGKEQIKSVETIAGVTGTTYTAQAADQGKYLACQERATNAGGSLSQASQALPAPAAPATPPPGGGGTPTPTPTPTPGTGGPLGGGSPQATDLTEPTSSITRRSCSAKTKVCSLTVKVGDQGGSDLSKAKLRATVTQVTGCPKAGKSKRSKSRAKACKKARSVTAKKTGTGLYSIKTPKMRKGKVRITVRAIDAANNEQSKATSVTLTVR